MLLPSSLSTPQSAATSSTARGTDPTEEVREWRKDEMHGHTDELRSGGLSSPMEKLQEQCSLYIQETANREAITNR